jgi:hypothetical protein
MGRLPCLWEETLITAPLRRPGLLPWAPAQPHRDWELSFGGLQDRLDLASAEVGDVTECIPHVLRAGDWLLAGAQACASVGMEKPFL